MLGGLRTSAGRGKREDTFKSLRVTSLQRAVVTGAGTPTALLGWGPGVAMRQLSEPPPAPGAASVEASPCTAGTARGPECSVLGPGCWWLPQVTATSGCAADPASRGTWIFKTPKSLPGRARLGRRLTPGPHRE